MDDINHDINVTKITEVLVDELNDLKKYNYKETTYDKGCSRKEHEKNRYICTHGWFIRCSWIKKVDILKRLAWETNNLYTNIHVMNTIYTATCKDWIYSSCQGLNLFKCDVILNDHHRCLDEEVLENVIEDLVNWYKTIGELKQYNLIMDMMQLADSCIIGKIFYEYLIIFKKRFEKVLMHKAKKGEKISMAEKKKQKQEGELEEILKFLNEEFPDHSPDPDAIELVNLLKNWNAFMVAYNARIGIGKVVESNQIKPKKKGKDSKKEKLIISKDLPDEIQLLPIWINKPLIASVDENTFRRLKSVNRYWQFIVKGIRQDVKCRQALNRTCAKLKNGLNICNIDEKNLDNQLAPRFTRISNVTDEAHRQHIQSRYNAKTTFTLLTDLYKVGSPFNASATTLEVFPRFTYAYKLDTLSYS